MSALQAVRGTHDHLPETRRAHRRVAEAAHRVTALYGFQEMATPIFEFTEVFQRTLGETSDVVTKEMYTFHDKGGEQITLRPEGTAGVVRAFVANGLQQALPQRLFYQGPVFRYERPQKGRLRQFHQVGVELLGVATPLADAEVIACAAAFLRDLGVAGDTTLEINTLGDAESRANYRDALVAYLRQYAHRLSDDSRERLERNPLRVLDSKDENDQAVVADAPSFLDYLNADSRAFFDGVCAHLAAMGLDYVMNPRLVRGLDYYCHTAFEFTTTILGAQGTVLAGGRYDGLVEQMGGSAVSGVGWAAGIERLAALIGDPEAPPRPVMMVPLGEEAERHALPLAERLRAAGHVVEMTYTGNLKKRLKRADRSNARAAVILGEDELAAGRATVRDLDTGQQDAVALDAVADALGQG